MTSRVLFEIPDGRGLTVQVREGVWRHIVQGHPEMASEEEAVRLTVSDPDLVVRPISRARGRGIERRINCRLGARSRRSRAYLWVPIDYGPEENWIVTAYSNLLTPKGEILYVRLPHRRP